MTPPPNDIGRKTPIPSAAEEDVQQALAILWARMETVPSRRRKQNP